jgi:hypothetical protein
MHKEVKRLATTDDSELANLAEAVGADKAIRVIERERLLLLGPPDAVRSAIISSGGWKDNESEAGSLIDQIYRWRHESPPNKRVIW